MQVKQMIPPAVSLAEAQAYVRIETGEEEAVLAGLVRTATAMCEQFTGQALVARTFEETLPGCGQWRKLSVTPVRSVSLVEAIADDGTATALPADAYAIDIDAAGDGHVRLTGAGARMPLRVTATGGMATECNDVPEPVRQGIVRLTAHLFNARDGTAGEPPAAVSALWRPYRRMRLA